MVHHHSTCPPHMHHGRSNCGTHTRRTNIVCHNNTGNSTSQSNPRNPDHQLRDSEKAAKAAANKANAEERASREFIVMRLPSNGKVDKIAEFKTFEKVIHEVSSDNLGSQGYDFLKSELKEVQLKRILKYGGTDYTGIYPLKVECPTKDVRDKFMQCAESGGFLDKRVQVEIGYYQKSKMSEEDFKKNAPKFYLTESTTYAQRKINREKAKIKEDLKNSEVHQNYLAWKKLDQQTTYKYTEEEYDALYAELYPPIDERNTSNAAKNAADNAAKIAAKNAADNSAKIAAENAAKNAANIALAASLANAAKSPPATHTHSNEDTTITTQKESGRADDVEEEMEMVETEIAPPKPKLIQSNSVDDLIKLAATSATGEAVFTIPNHMQTNQLNLNMDGHFEDPLRFKSQWGQEVSLLATNNTPSRSPISSSHPPGVQSRSPPKQTRSANDSAEVSKILSEITDYNTDILALIKENRMDEAQELALKQEILRINLEKKYNHKSPPHQHFHKNIRVQVPTTHNDGPARKRLDSGRRTDSHKRSWSQDAKSPDLKSKSGSNQAEKQTPSSPSTGEDKLNNSNISVSY